MRTKILGFLTTGLVFATFGLFASAASAAKIYTMVVQSTGTNTVAVTIHNVTPENNSTINSFVINKPYSGASLSPLSSSAAATVVSDGNGNVKVSAFDGLKSANRNPNTITINLTVNWGTAGPPTCGTPVNWTAIVYTGTFSNTTFQLVDVTSNNTNISSVPMSLNCFSVSGLPSTVPAGGSSLPTTVTVSNNSGAGGGTLTSLSLSTTTGSVTITPVSPISLGIAPGTSASVSVVVSAPCSASGNTGVWNASGTIGGVTTTPTGTLGSLNVQGSCSYSLSVLPTSINAGTSTPATVTVRNDSASGGPTLNRLTLALPSGMTISPNPVTGLNLAPGVTTTVAVSVSAPCGASAGSWGSSANSASDGSGAAFTPPAATAFNVVECYLLFTPKPPAAIVSGQIVKDPVVGLTAYAGGGSVLASWDGNVTWSLSPSVSGSGVTDGGVKTGGSGAYFYPDLIITGAVGSSFSLVASTTLGTSAATASVTSTPAFTIFPGVLFCGGLMDSALTNDPSSTGVFGDPGTGAGKRWSNKDGSPCVLVGYNFTNTILADNTVKLEWDIGTQPNAVFDYTVFWKPEFVDPNTGLPKRRTKVAWQTDSSGPIWVWGNACLSKDPPAVYATVASDLGSTLNVTINTIGPITPLPAVPFAIVVGRERMTVTSTGVGGTNWSVVRGAGGTGAYTVTHSAGAKVMSTPLPIDVNRYLPNSTTAENPYYKKQVNMCIWDEEFQSYTRGGTNLYDCATPPAPSGPAMLSDVQPVACVIRKTSVFDIGDGFMSLDN